MNVFSSDEPTLSDAVDRLLSLGYTAVIEEECSQSDIGGWHGELQESLEPTLERPIFRYRAPRKNAAKWFSRIS